MNDSFLRKRSGKGSFLQSISDGIDRQSRLSLLCWTVRKFRLRRYSSNREKTGQTRRKLNLRKTGLKEREKVQKIVAKLHESVAFMRTDFPNEESAKIAHPYGRISVEDFRVNGRNSRRCLNRIIRTAAWFQVFSFFSYKGESAGRESRKINPACRSERCSFLVHREEKMSLSDRISRCPCSGMKRAGANPCPDYFERRAEVSGVAPPSSAV